VWAGAPWRATPLPIAVYEPGSGARRAALAALGAGRWARWARWARDGGALHRLPRSRAAAGAPAAVAMEAQVLQTPARR